MTETAGGGGGAAGAPLLMLDTGGYMALINAIAFTPDGQQLVSASDDKTIRVWDLATGKTVRTIRGESAPGHPGKIFAMALSPDGKWLAAGGWFHPTNPIESSVVRLYDFASGRLVSLLKGHDDTQKLNDDASQADLKYPHCGRRRIYCYCTARGLQRYKCLAWGRTFNAFQRAVIAAPEAGALAEIYRGPHAGS